MGAKTKKSTIKFQKNRLKDVIGDRRRNQQKRAYNAKVNQDRKEKHLERRAERTQGGPRPQAGRGLTDARPLADMDFSQFMESGLEDLLEERTSSSGQQDQEFEMADDHSDAGSQGSGESQDELSANEDSDDDNEQADANEDSDDEEDEEANDRALAALDRAGEDDEEEADDDTADGADDDDEEGEDADDAGLDKLEDEVKQHRAQLQRLKETQPEFFDFLDSEDQNLLNFGEDDDEDDEEAMDDEAEPLDDSDEEGSSSKKSKSGRSLADRETLTVKKIRAWGKLLKTKPAGALKHVIQGFLAAAYGFEADNADADTKGPPVTLRYTISSSRAYSEMVQLALAEVPRMLDRLLPAKGKAQHRVPAQRKNWRLVRSHVKYFCQGILHLLPQSQDHAALGAILQMLVPFMHYIACFPKLARQLLKQFFPLFTAGNEKLTVVTFLCMRALILVSDDSFMEIALKGVYLSFVKSARFTTVISLPKISLMRNAVCELYTLNTQLAYKHAFVYIRQLAVHLRNAIVHKKRENLQQVYCWPFVHCLRLWAQVLGRHLEDLAPQQRQDNIMSSLVYPLVQVTLGVVHLIPTSRYFPLRFHCLKTLNLLSEWSGVFVPVAFAAMDVLESSDMGRKPKPSTGRPLNMDVLLKVSKTNLGTQQFQKAVVEQMQEVLLDFFAIHATKIGFPELIVPCQVALKRCMKKARNGEVRQTLSQLVSKLEENKAWVTRSRQNVTFSPKDTQQILTLEQQLRSSNGSPLLKYRTSWQKIVQQRRQLLQQQAEQRYLQSDEPVVTKKGAAGKEAAGADKKAARAKRAAADAPALARELPTKKSKQELREDIDNMSDDDDIEEDVVGEDLSWMNE
ncbi:uncharacterized protein MONBRDRAFT_37390 [Monosiga brevicollis MX1]|uniref:Nucleolar complex protein 2 homolog n=1 Tax=Monosiga brevicollis TaxID=81824 RepID=A9V1E9_MONBE|nr:uncharacterized protein MONBRDRAFT_37390 [Monosiga brevicollis MX1]EDQ88555.1 predicted protein [Monosiga brevicollis MX1]|eukprot:XP_001746659.1 hypothetical protein [Monosiga brevicollis MX1]